MLTWLLRRIAHLPLPMLHALGALAGWFYFGTGRMGRRAMDNLRASGIAPDEKTLRRLCRATARESGKGALETFAIWQRPQSVNWVRTCHGWEHVEQAWAARKSIIFLTPHLGCFEIAAQYYAAHRPISVLYRPPRKAWMMPLVSERERDNIRLAPTTLRGVRELLKALKQGEAVGILPDQNPGKNEGVWADFFGRPAYTMTLARKLAEATDATVLTAFGERLPYGRGYALHIEPLTDTPTPQAINRALETLIRRKPEQYLWSYPRHRRPRGVELPPDAGHAEI
ncbi:MAG: lysophospholipid acyltransferase family protein [Methylobacillus sp.]|jgi:KDO2-lipid IV(A) lauroyltransferase|nr:lysophospholipid acyltransferase family protein [Methylobacillus sp.]